MRIKPILLGCLVVATMVLGCNDKEKDHTYVVSAGSAAQTGEYHITLAGAWKPKAESGDKAEGGEFVNPKMGGKLLILFWKDEQSAEWNKVRLDYENLLERLRSRPGFIETFGHGFIGGFGVTIAKSAGGNVPHARINGCLLGPRGVFTVTGESRDPLDSEAIGEIKTILESMQTTDFKKLKS